MAAHVASRMLSRAHYRHLVALKEGRTWPKLFELFPGFGERTIEAAVDDGMFTPVTVARLERRIDELTTVGR